MKNKNNSTKNVSVAFIVVWAALLIMVIATLLWLSLASNSLNGQDYELSPPIEIELPDPVPLDEHILKDDKLEVEGDSASIQNTPNGEEHLFFEYADNSFTENSAYGPIPKNGNSLEMTLARYAAETNNEINNKKKVAFIFSGLGREHQCLEKIIEETPSEITLSFLPYTVNLQQTISLVRSKGHEILISASMEPTDYPKTDPGPNTLLTGFSSDKNLDRLQWTMAKGSEYIGVMNLNGSLFLSSQNDLKPILEDINNRGLIFVEAVSTYRSHADEIAAEFHIPYLRSHFVIDETLTPKELHSTMIRAEQMAEQSGFIMIVAQCSPRTLPILVKWIQKAQENDFVFIPVSQALGISHEFVKTSHNTKENHA